MRFFSGNRNGNGSGDKKSPAASSFMEKLKGIKKSGNEATFAAIKEKCEGAYNKMLADHEKGRSKTIGGRSVQQKEMSQTAKDTLALLARRKAQKEVKKEEQQALERERQKKNKVRQVQLLEAQSRNRDSSARDHSCLLSSSPQDKEKSYFFGYSDDEPVT